jgi:hypothetical protein
LVIFEKFNIVIICILSSSQKGGSDDEMHLQFKAVKEKVLTQIGFEPMSKYNLSM